MMFAFDQTTRNTRKSRLSFLLLWRTGVLAILFASVGATRVAAQAGALESTFADFSLNDYASAVGIDSHGRIVVAGHASGLFENDFALVRLNSDGSPDNSFGISREVQTKVGVSRSAAAAKSTASPGVVFSASGEPSTFSCKNTTCSGPAQFGFWIWCTAPSSTSSGNCRGFMFFHNLEPIAVHVTGAVTLTGTTATISVSSPTTAAIAVACTLVNNSLVSGRNNTVTVTCDGASWTKPGPSGSSTTNADAIVQIINHPNETSSLQRPLKHSREGDGNAGTSSPFPTICRYHQEPTHVVFESRNGRFAIRVECHQRASARLTLNSIDCETGRNASRRG